MGKRNEGNAENKGENARNRMGMWVRKISLVMQGMWVMWNQGDDAGNQGENLSIAVEMTQNSFENNKFKEWR